MMRFMKIAAAAALAIVTVGAAEAKDWSKVLIGTEGAILPSTI